MNRNVSTAATVAIAVLFLTATPRAGAQQPALRVYSVENGLKYPQTFSVLQDRHGLIWAGTSYGVSRYDGREFATLTKADGLPHDSVRALGEADDGAIWALTDLGVARIDPLGGALGRPRTLPAPARPPSRPRLLRSGDGSVWIVDERRLLECRRDACEERATPPGRAPRDIVEFGPVSRGAAWLAFADGLAEVRPATAPGSRTIAVRGGTPLAIEARGDELWLLQPGRISFPLEPQRRPLPLPPDAAATGMAIVGDLAIVFAGAAGIVVVDRDGALRRFGPAQGFRAGGANAAIADTDGLIWLATEDGLVKIIDLDIVSIPSSAGLLGSLVLTFANDLDGSLLIGHSEGVARRRDGTLRPVSLDTRGTDAGVWAILPLPGGGVLAATRHGLLHIVGERGRRCTTGGPLATERIFDLAAASGSLWASTRHGVVRFAWDERAAAPTAVEVFDTADGSPLGEARVLAPDRDGLWIGTDGSGVLRWEGGRFRRFDTRHGLPSGVCRVLLVRPEGVWVGTNAGVWLLRDGAARPLETINRQLGDPYVAALAADPSGAVWLATSYEVLRIAEGKVVARFDHDTGLVGAATTAENCLQVMEGGGVRVGMIGGMTELPSAVVGAIRPRPAILITSAVTGGDRAVQPGERLGYPQPVVAFTFSSPTFLAEHRTRFQEWLEGYDADWTTPHAAPNQRYTNLRPGRYVLHARAVAPGGTVSAAEAVLSFEIRQPWWGTWPFRLAALGLLALAVHGLVVVRTGRIARRAAHLETLVAERTAALETANTELERLATLDGLTGISNRRLFDRHLAAEWNRAIRARTPVSLVLLDIDLFKPFNDAAGHQAGDDCLRRVASLIAAQITRPGDIAARWGGEEFVVLLPGTGEAGALAVAERVAAALATAAIPHPASPIGPHVTVSQGVATAFPTRDEAPTLLVAAADTALYQAKAQGRNRIVVG